MYVLDPAAGKNAVPDPSISVKDIASHCRSYQDANTGRALFQLVTTLVLFAGLCTLMHYSTSVSYWITAVLTIPAAGLLIRLFIFQHDCGHGSFFKSKTANDWIGRFLGILTFTPYDFWRRAHNLHHATSGDLDNRSIGGIDTITVREYQTLSKWQKLTYRLYRNPFFLLMLGTPFYVLFVQRLPLKQSTHFHEDYRTLQPSSIWKSIMMNNMALLCFCGLWTMILGGASLLSVYLPILIVTSWIGGWLFYIQHQFENAYWEKHENWDRAEAALAGSSYYVLPKVLQWFTGNIGLHHIHHLCSKVPNYRLQECMNDLPALKQINRLTLRQSLGCLRYKLWDEQKCKLVGFSEIALP